MEGLLLHRTDHRPAPGRTAGLQWDDLNLETGELQVTKQVYRTKEDGLLISQPKTKSSIRTVSLPPPLLNILKEYKESVNSRWMFPAPVKEDSPLDPAYIRTRLHLILEHAQCKQIRFHDLRHTFATMALGSGMDVKTLSSMLGHVSAATTLDIYTHITGDMQRAAAPALTEHRQGRAAGRSGAGAERHRGLPAMWGRKESRDDRLWSTEINDHFV